MKKDYYMVTTSLRTIFYYCIGGDTVEIITIYGNNCTTVFTYTKLKINQYAIGQNFIKIQPGPFMFIMQALSWFKQWLAANKLFDTYEENKKEETLTFDECTLMLHGGDKNYFSFKLIEKKSYLKVKLPPQINKIRELIIKIADASLAYCQTKR